MLRLNNIKNYLSSQCQHRKIQLSIVPSNYTSQRCSHCGSVDKDNRKTQEEFLCLNCGHQDNADSNASKNIKDYKDLNVLSSKLLVQKNGWFIPKVIGKQVIKGILNDCFEQYS